MKNRYIHTLLLCSLLCAAACSTPQVRTVENKAATPSGAGAAQSAANQPSTPPADEAAAETSDEERVKAGAAEVQLAAGGSADAKVRLEIAEGYHVNANPPSDKFLIGTELEVETEEAIQVGKPAYPAPVTRKFKFSEKPLAVYEGNADIKLPLKAQAGAAKGRRTLKARVRVQPCNDEVCFPPRVLETLIPVNIN